MQVRSFKNAEQALQSPWHSNQRVLCLERVVNAWRQQRICAYLALQRPANPWMLEVRKVKADQCCRVDK